jgi:peptidoglycan hydrolase CwlO-like protein
MESYLMSIISSSITGVITYFVGLNRAKKETDNLTLSNIEKSISIYQTIVDDLKKEIMTLNSKVKDLEEKIDDLMSENHNLKKMLETKTKRTKAVE